jgi:hypothetical protein
MSQAFFGIGVPLDFKKCMAVVLVQGWDRMKNE